MLASHVQPQPLCPSTELMNLYSCLKWNIDDVDTKLPKNSIPNWFLTVKFTTTNDTHLYPGILALVVMALTVGTRVAGIHSSLKCLKTHMWPLPPLPICMGFSLIWSIFVSTTLPITYYLIVEFVWFHLHLESFRYWRIKYIILKDNILYCC